MPNTKISKNVQHFHNFAKEVKLSPIWSHCTCKPNRFPICQIGHIGESCIEKKERLVYEETKTETVEKEGGSGCDPVGRTVASDTWDWRFESSHRQILFTVSCTDKTRIMKKRLGMDH